MTTRAIKSNYKYHNVFPNEYLGSDIVSISSRQRRDLQELIYLNITDEDVRENYLSQIEDITQEEANSLILDFQLANWR